ncbi:MAG: sigma-54 factor interaction domain-containing protein, partial [Victivallales bacterium]|nr:sigma-54 factor interaction domain-containing protein [Victivallales bacterium]
MIGEHPTMQELYKQMEKVAGTDMAVMIRGESGTGKELVAKSLHRLSRRGNRPFVAINCTAIPANLLESELFGHVKGAFTGAVRNKEGLFQVADGGTLFMDEIGSIPLEMQRSLLRVLQDGLVRPVGGVT